MQYRLWLLLAVLIVGVCLPLCAQDAASKWQESSEDARYKRSADGIVWDTKTNLEWLPGPDRDTTWDEAKAWVDKQTIDGGGWRMPTLEELKGIITHKKNRYGIYMDNIFNMSRSWVWSGILKDEHTAWDFCFCCCRSRWPARNDARDNVGFAVRAHKPQ